MNIQSWVPKVPTQPTIYFLNRHVKVRGMDRRVIKLFGKCRIKEYRITVYFSKNKTEITPFLAERGLDFYVYKGSIYEHEIYIEYSMQGLSVPFACVGSGDPVRVLRLYTVGVSRGYTDHHQGRGHP